MQIMSETELNHIRHNNYDGAQLVNIRIGVFIGADFPTRSIDPGQCSSLYQLLLYSIKSVHLPLPIDMASTCLSDIHFPT